MHTFLDNFHQGGNYSAQTAIYLVELSKEEKITDLKYLSISFLQTDYLNLDSKSVCSKNSERANNVQTKCTFFGSANHSAEKHFKIIRKETEKSRAAGD